MGLALKGEGGQVRACCDGLSTCETNAGTIVRGIDDPALRQCIVAGFIPRPGEESCA